MVTERRRTPGRRPEPSAELGVVVLYAVGALLAAMALLAATIMPDWLATPVVAVTMLGAGLALTLLGGDRRRAPRPRRRRT